VVCSASRSSPPRSHPLKSRPNTVNVIGVFWCVVFDQKTTALHRNSGLRLFKPPIKALLTWSKPGGGLSIAQRSARVARQRYPRSELKQRALVYLISRRRQQPCQSWMPPDAGLTFRICPARKAPEKRPSGVRCGRGDCTSERTIIFLGA